MAKRSKRAAARANTNCGANFWDRSARDALQSVHVDPDRDGPVGINRCVYGVPETFVISEDGHTAHKCMVPITPKDPEKKYFI